jgi:iron(III) transport system substrate-binding protein
MTKATHVRLMRGVVCLFAVALLTAGCGSDDSDDSAGDGPSGASGSTDGVPEELIEAAQEEGTVVFLTSLPQIVAERAAEAFEEEYDIGVEFLEISSNDLMQRYQTEASAGNISADLITVAGGDAFLTDAVEQEWIAPIQDLELPVLESGDFPDEFIAGDAATINILPWLIAYNADDLEEGDVAQTFEELGDPKFKGELNITDPSISDAHVQVWKVIRDTYGDEALEAVADNEPRYYDSSGPVFQALAAGEGSVTGPQVASAAKAVQDASAPIELVRPPVTTGVEQRLMITDPDVAAHPNAAKLFANWLMSEPGNVLTAGEDVVSIYDESGLPEGYESPPPFTEEEKQEIIDLLGA